MPKALFSVSLQMTKYPFSGTAFFGTMILPHKLLDYQPSMFKGMALGDKTRIKKAAICAAKAANILGIHQAFASFQHMRMRPCA